MVKWEAMAEMGRLWQRQALPLRRMARTEPYIVVMTLAAIMSLTCSEWPPENQEIRFLILLSPYDRIDIYLQWKFTVELDEAYIGNQRIDDGR